VVGATRQPPENPMHLSAYTRGAALATFLMCSLTCSVASAQSSQQLPEFDLEHLDVNLGKGSLLIGDGSLVSHDGVSFNTVMHYQRLPLVLSDGAETIQALKHRVTLVLSGSYGVLDWLEVGVQVPLVAWQLGADLEKFGLNPLSSQGLGTPLIQGRLGLVKHSLEQPVDLSADVGLGLPLGTRSALAGDTGVRTHGRLTGGITFGLVRASMEAGVLLRPAVLLANTGTPLKPGPLAELRLAAGVTTTNPGIQGELTARTLLNLQSSQFSLEVMGGLKIPLSPGFSAFVMGGRGLSNTLGTPLFRGILGVVWLWEPPPAYESPPAYRSPTALGPSKATQAEGPSGSVEARPTQPTEMIRLGRGKQEASSGVSDNTPRIRPYQPTSQEMLVVRERIGFSQGSNKVPDVVPILDRLALRLQTEPKAFLVIEGHAFAEGTSTPDLVFSLERAQAVRDYFVGQGIPRTRLRLIGLGSDLPTIDSPITDEERQLNRRVEVLMVRPLPDKLEKPVAPPTPSP